MKREKIDVKDRESFCLDDILKRVKQRKKSEKKKKALDKTTK